VISDSDPDPVYEWWIQDLNLLKVDRDVLTDGMELTDNLINATLVLLGAQFPKLDGFQNTILGHHLDFKRVSDSRPSVQILHTGIVSRFHIKSANCLACCLIIFISQIVLTLYLHHIVLQVIVTGFVPHAHPLVLCRLWIAWVSS